VEGALMPAAADDSRLRLSPQPLGGGRFRYLGERYWCSWNGVYGGALLGALIRCMETVTGKPLVTVNAQFVANVPEGADLLLHAESLVAGSVAAQATAAAYIGEKLVARAGGSFGEVGADGRVAASFPSVRPPAESPPRTFLKPLPGGLNESMDVRVAGVAAPRCWLWVRCPDGEGLPMTASLLSAFADHPPYGTGLLMGEGWYGITLDKALRLCGPLEGVDAGAWTLVEIVFDTMAPPFAHATVNLWSEAGRLLAIGGQSMRIRHGIASKS
jgi:acyl-CoA thioesterase